MAQIRWTLYACLLTVPLVAAVAPSSSATSDSAQAAEALPDLLVDQVDSFVQIPDGDALAHSYIRIDVSNVGQAVSGATTATWTIQDTIAYNAAALGRSAGFSRSGTYELPAIAGPAGHSQQVYVGDYSDGAPTPGGFNRYFVHVIVDPANTVQESDEGNNELTRDAWGGELALCHVDDVDCVEVGPACPQVYPWSELCQGDAAGFVEAVLEGYPSIDVDVAPDGLVCAQVYPWSELCQGDVEGFVRNVAAALPGLCVNGNTITIGCFDLADPCWGAVLEGRKPDCLGLDRL